MVCKILVVSDRLLEFCTDIVFSDERFQIEVKSFENGNLSNIRKNIKKQNLNFDHVVLQVGQVDIERHIKNDNFNFQVLAFLKRVERELNMIVTLIKRIFSGAKIFISCPIIKNLAETIHEDVVQKVHKIYGKIASENGDFLWI